MELQRQKLVVAVLVCFLVAVRAAGGSEAKAVAIESGGVYNDQTKEVKVPPEPNDVQSDGAQQLENVVVISEKTLMELEAAKKLNQTKVPEIKEDPKPAADEVASAANSQVHVEESIFKQKPFHTNMDMEIPNSFKLGFYFFLALSSSAILFIVVKVYRLRLSRAERKYGVQGDRSTQELTPLPISIEDGNSDEDDQTLFEINRHDIRIF